MDKLVASIGIENVNYFSQPKKHVEYEMYNIITGYEVRDNDIKNGGRDFYINLIWIFQMVQ